MLNWLWNQYIEFSETTTKAQLQIFINNTQKEPVYRIDELQKIHGLTVLRLPPYQTDLNTIGLVWADLKHCTQNYINSSLDEKINLFQWLLDLITGRDKRVCNE